MSWLGNRTAAKGDIRTIHIAEDDDSHSTANRLLNNARGPEGPLNFTSDQKDKLKSFFNLDEDYIDSDIEIMKLLGLINEIAIYGYDKSVSVYERSENRSYKDMPSMKYVKHKSILKNLNYIFQLDSVEGEQQCPRCKGYNTSTSALQLRSADEGNTIIGYCNPCQKEFRP